MNNQQRKYHFAIWVVIGISVSILFVLAFPKINSPNLEQETISDGLYIINKKDQYSFSISTKSTDLKNQFEIQVIKPFKNASVSLYADSIDSNNLLGNIFGVGTYQFDTTNQIDSLVFYDLIKRETIIKTKLRWE